MISTAVALGCVLVCAISGADVEESVARLDGIASVGDPEVKEIAALGEPAVPHLIDRLTSPRRLTALGSVWAFKHMADEHTLPAILENWAECKHAGTKTQAAEALHAVVRAKQRDWVTCRGDSLDYSLSALAQAVLCPMPGTESRFAVHGTSEDSPVRVYASGITSSATLGCAEAAMELVSAGEVYSGPVGQRFLRFDCMIQQVPPPSEPVPSTEATWGAVPEAVAVVQIISGTEGRGNTVGSGSAWVLAGGAWQYVAPLYGMLFD